MWVIISSITIITISLLGYENGSSSFLRNVAMHIPEYSASVHNDYSLDQKENSKHHHSPPTLNLQASNLTNQVASLQCSLTRITIDYNVDVRTRRRNQNSHSPKFVPVTPHTHLIKLKQ